ncbi:glycosyltransferase [Myroides sp. LJL115]
MKKILFVLPSFRTGGVERVTLNIINSLNFYELDVHLLIIEKGSNYLLPDLNSKVTVTELGFNSLRESTFSIKRYIDSVRPDYVFTSFNHLSVFFGMLKFIFNYKFKSIIRLNSLPSNKLKSNWRDSIYNLFFRKIVEKAYIVISQSSEMTREICEYYNIESKDVLTIRNPVDEESILKKSKEHIEDIFDKDYYNLLSIGSLSSVKGFDLLIEAVKNLEKKGINNYRLYIIGSNRETNEDYYTLLVNLINSYKIMDRVFLLGYKKNPYPYLAKCDAFVLSSRKEGFPNVVLEALVLKKPCLVTNCVDLKDVVDHNKGIIVNKDSVLALEEGILNIPSVSGGHSSFQNFDFNSLFNQA